LKSNKFWVALLCTVVAASIVAMFILGQTRMNIVRIYQDNVLLEVVNIFEITERRNIVLQSGIGTNVIAIEYGRIRMLEADCPDGACVRKGWVGSGIMPIVCLPHRIVIEFTGCSNADVDAVVG